MASTNENALFRDVTVGNIKNENNQNSRRELRTLTLNKTSSGPKNSH
jgi:hypothetical protein